jgi:membrane protein
MLKAELQMEKQRKIDCVCQFFRYFWSNFFSDNCLQHATALSYTTLLSLVPLMAVILSVFTAFPLFEDVSLQLQIFVFENFVPASSEVVQQYIQQFSENASKLTGPGLISLVITSIMMMAAIDNSLNKIWRDSKPRRPVARLIVYWSVLTLGPILVGVSFAISSYIVSLPLLSETAFYGEKLGLLRMLPFFMEALAFTLLYVVVPNCQVTFRSALTGGVTATLLFELAKKAFSFYIISFPAYETIYGAMSTVPVFLVWIFLSWSITLIGAELAWCIETFNEGEKEGGVTAEETGHVESIDSRLARIAQIPR